MRTDEENFELWLKGFPELANNKDSLYLAWVAACESRDKPLLDVDSNQLTFLEG